jgi:hypothetical protein|tara:strand:+ start:1247 stop:1609 length:363 start_codon:yes stop_codon:yes gene_type:complete
MSSRDRVNMDVKSYLSSMGRFNDLYGYGVGNKAIGSNTGQGYGFQNEQSGRQFNMPSYTGATYSTPEDDFDTHLGNMFGGMTLANTREMGFLGQLFEHQARQSYRPTEAKKYEAPDVENL